MALCETHSASVVGLSRKVGRALQHGAGLALCTDSMGGVCDLRRHQNHDNNMIHNYFISLFTNNLCSASVGG